MVLEEEIPLVTPPDHSALSYCLQLTLPGRTDGYAHVFLWHFRILCHSIYWDTIYSLQKHNAIFKFLLSEQKVKFLRLSYTLILQHGVPFNLRRSHYYSISAWGKCIKDPTSLILLSQAPLTLLDPWALV